MHILGNEAKARALRMDVLSFSMRPSARTRRVASLREKQLEEDEAFLILKSIEAFGPGAVVVALVGHNQAINTGELGIVAWFKAARDRGWRVSIGETTTRSMAGPT